MHKHSFSAMGKTFVRYVFDKGEGLPMHSHSEDHLTIVASGKIEAKSLSISIHSTPQSSPILFRANREHEIVAMEENTVVINVF